MPRPVSGGWGGGRKTDTRPARVSSRPEGRRYDCSTVSLERADLLMAVK